MKKLLIITAMLVGPCLLFAQLRIVYAGCNGKENPVGVPPTHIELQWKLTSLQRNQIQTAYQWVIASSATNLQTGQFDIYNSGKQESSESINVYYKGKSLNAATTYYWKVRVWDGDGMISAWSATQQFTTALNDNDWGNAQWIGYEELPADQYIVPGEERVNKFRNASWARVTIPYIRKSFSVNKPLKQALLFVSGLGHYELEVNGRKPNTHFLAPGWTDYQKTVLYNTVDITTNLKTGANAIGAIVGNGFHNTTHERYLKYVGTYGAPKLLAKIVLKFTDGSTETIDSDASWQTTASPVTYTSIYGGEDYDAQREQTGWSQPSFLAKGWKQAIVVRAPNGKLQPEIDYPVQVMDTIRVKSIRKVGDGYLYDFGQNASGIISLKVQGKKGDSILIVPSELIDSVGLPNQNATGNPFYHIYKLKGVGQEQWQPRFTYYGFRYCWVKGAAQIKELAFLHTRNSTPATGSFVSSNRLVNRIDTLIRWAIKSNLQSVVTDCPHREKLGWMEQTHLMGNSIQYNYDIKLLYQQLVADMMDAQLPNGLVPDIAPEYVVFGGGFRDSPEWGSAAVILPWLLYKWYGDSVTMQRAYSMMKRYVAYLESKSKDHIVDHGLGDWYDYGPAFPGEAQLTPRALTATAIYYYDVQLLQKIAALLKNNEDEQKFNAQATAVRMSFNNKFFDRARKVFSTGSQTAMAMPLCVGLVDSKDRARVLKNLIDSVQANGKALTAGDIGFHYLVQALTEGNGSSLLFDMINRDDVPGYGFQLKKGATALTESWPALEEVSNNHLMLGHIMEWFYAGLAGIQQEEGSVGYKQIAIKPNWVGDLYFVRASFESPYGTIESRWQKKGGTIVLAVDVPVNTEASIYVPVEYAYEIYKNNQLLRPGEYKQHEGKAIIKVGSGAYSFRCRKREG